jgi:hypothetical protein
MSVSTTSSAPRSAGPKAWSWSLRVLAEDRIRERHEQEGVGERKQTRERIAAAQEEQRHTDDRHQRAGQRCQPQVTFAVDVSDGAAVGSLCHECHGRSPPVPDGSLRLRPQAQELSNVQRLA